MATDLSILQRQIREGNVNLGNNQGFAALSQSFNQLSSTLSDINTNIKVEQAAQEGAAERLSGKTRSSLAPGATAATRSFNEAYRTMDINLGVNEGEEFLAQSLINYMSADNLKNPNAVEAYKATSEGAIEGVLETLLPEDRPTAALALRKKAANNSIKLLGAQSQFLQTQQRQEGASLIDKKSTELVDASAMGNPDFIQELYSDLETIVYSQVELGYFGEDTADKYLKLAQQNILNGKVEHAYNMASIEPFGGEKFITAVFNDEVEGLQEVSYTEKQGILQHLLKVQKDRKEALNAVEQVADAKLDKLIAVQQITNTQELRQAAINLDAEGFPMSELSLEKKETNLIIDLKKANARAVTNGEISKAALTGSNKLYQFSESDLNNFFFDMVDNRKQMREQQVSLATNDAEAAFVNTPDWQIEMSIAESVPTTIPKYKQMLRDRILDGGIEEKVNAIKAYRYVSQNNPRGMRGFDSKAGAFADVVGMRMENTNVAPELLIQEANDTVLKADEEAHKKREAELTKYYNKSPNYISSLSTRIYNKDLGGPVNDEMWNAVKTEMDTNYQLTGNISDAEAITIKNMKQSTGVSKFGAPSKPMQNPPENLPYYGFGYTVDNQFPEMIERIARQGEQFKNELPYEIKRSSKMVKFPSNPTEKDLYENNYFKGQGWLNIDERDCRIFLVSAGLNQSNAVNGPAYQIMYEDQNGYIRPLLMMMPQTDAFGNKSHILSPGMMLFKSPDEYIPHYFEQLSEESAIKRTEYDEMKVDEYATKEAEEEFGALTLKDFAGFSGQDIEYHFQTARDEFVMRRKEGNKKKLEAEKARRELSKLQANK